MTILDVATTDLVSSWTASQKQMRLSECKFGKHQATLAPSPNLLFKNNSFQATFQSDGWPGSACEFYHPPTEQELFLTRRRLV